MSGQGSNPRCKEAAGGFAASVSPCHLPSTEDSDFHLSFVVAWSGLHDISSNIYVLFLLDIQCYKKSFKNK